MLKIPPEALEGCDLNGEWPRVGDATENFESMESSSLLPDLLIDLSHPVARRPSLGAANKVTIQLLELRDLQTRPRPADHAETSARARPCRELWHRKLGW